MLLSLLDDLVFIVGTRLETLSIMYEYLSLENSFVIRLLDLLLVRKIQDMIISLEDITTYLLRGGLDLS